MLGFLLLLFFSDKPLGFQIIIGSVTSVMWSIIIYHTSKFTILYYLFLYLFHYKKIDNDKYSLNEQIISKAYLFYKVPENLWKTINKFYKVHTCYGVTSSMVRFSMLVREKGKKDRGIIKKLEVRKKAIYFEGEKIFDQLYDLSALDNFLKSTIQDK